MAKGRGRRGRRTQDMVHIANNRIARLFECAEKEAANGDIELSHRYTTLAFSIAKRYNVRFSPEQKSVFCRKCCAYLLDSKTSTTRIRNKRVIRRCLKCGNVKRISLYKAKKSME